MYTDLGLLAKNTKDLMPKESKNLRTAINKAVVYNQRGAYLNATGISTAYPYISENRETISENALRGFLTQNSMPDAQKNLYKNLMALNTSNLNNLELSWNKNGHVVAELEPEQLNNVLMVRCMMLPVVEGGDSDLGLKDTGTVILFSDDIDIDWKSGIVTENIRPVYPTIDGHRIMMYLQYQGNGYKFYKVPVILQRAVSGNTGTCSLMVRYDISKKEYSILGIGDEVDNGVPQISVNSTLGNGDIITPIFLAAIPEGSEDLQNNVLFEYSYIAKYQEKDPETGEPLLPVKEGVANSFLQSETILELTGNNGKKLFIRPTAGESFVYSQNSKIIEKKISRGDYVGFFQFIAPNGTFSRSLPFTFSVRYGEIYRDVLDESDLNEVE